MSTPLAAGVGALAMSALGKGNVDVYTLRNLLIATAKPVEAVPFGSISAGTLDSVVKQGGGLVDAYHAVHHKTRVSPAIISLSDIKHAKLQQTIEVKNTGTTPQTYTFAHKAAATLLSLNATSSFWNHFPVPADPQHRAATLTFSPTTLTVQPGAKGTFSVSIQPPNIESTLIPMYSGWISVNCAEDAALGSANIPYFGVLTDFSKESVFDLYQSAGGHFTPALIESNRAPIHNDSTVWTLKQLQSGGYDSPQITWRLRLGSPHVRVDLVAANTTFRATHPISDTHNAQVNTRRSTSIRGGTWRAIGPDLVGRAVTAATRFDDVETIGQVFDDTFFERDYWDDEGIRVGLHPTVLSGPQLKEIAVPDGQYRYLLRAGKLVQDDYSLEDSYDSYLSHAFTIKASSKTA